MNFDPSLARTRPFAHQAVGAQRLLDQPALALFDEMGSGKSKQVIDAACALASAGRLDFVVVVAPASVRGVWADEATGEIQKHGWRTLSHWVHEYAAGRKDPLAHGWAAPSPDSAAASLSWVVTNYEFLRGDARLAALLSALRGRGAGMLVLDESSYVKSRGAKQTKAVKKLRQACARCALLNGTPVMNNPLDLWSQLDVLDPKILGRKYKNYFHFRYAHAILGGWHDKQILGWRDLEQVQRAIAPYALRRLKRDCLDLPEKLYETREVALDEPTWRTYKTLRDEALIALGEGDDRLEPNAAVRLLRLSQLTSGILGGFEPYEESGETQLVAEPVTRDVSDEKLRWALSFLDNEHDGSPVIIWTRWRRERERLAALLRARPNTTVCEIYGGQPRQAREAAVAVFGDGKILSPDQFVLLAQPHAGGFGLNLTAAATAVFLSNDYLLGMRLQAEDRCHRAGQRQNVTYLDVLATGPKGQRTIDHAVLKALRAKEQLAMWTASAWQQELEGEDA